MLLWLEATPSLTGIQEISHLGLTSAALIAVVILWRDNLALRESNQALLREILQAAQGMKEIPVAIGRLREEMLSALRTLRVGTRNVPVASTDQQDFGGG